MLIILLSLTLIAVLALGIMNFYSTSEAGSEPSIDEIIENSWELEGITTNLSNGDFLKASFQIHADTKKARKELEKRDFQIRNIVIHELAGRTAKDLRSQEGMDSLESDLRDRLNDKLDSGQVIRVYITDRVVQ